MKRYIKSATIKDSDLNLEQLDYSDILDLATDSMDADLLRILSTFDDSDAYLKGLVAQNPNTPYDVAIKLLNEGYGHLYTTIIDATNPDILAYFSDNPDPEVREFILNNDNTSIDTIRKLLNDGTPYNLNYLSWREDLPDDLIIQMYKFGNLDQINRMLLLGTIYEKGLQGLL